MNDARETTNGACDVLVVEDDRNMGKAIRRALLQAGWRVVLSDDPAALQTDVKRHRPQVVTLDLMMPQVSGLALLAEIRQTFGPLCPRVLILSAAGRDRLRDATAAGADAVMPKPFRNEDLVAVVRELLAAPAAGSSPSAS